MKLLLNDFEKQLLNEYIETKYVNINIVDILQECFNLGKIKIDSNYIEQGYDEKTSLVLTLMDYLQIDMEDEENQELIQKFLINNIKKQDTNTYLSDEYCQKVKPIPYENNKYQLKYLFYSPYQIFPLDEIVVNDDFSEYSQIGYFERPFKYLAILKNNVIWMSLNPNEINTMKPYINNARGNVLVGGLGLGYVAFQMSLKSNVSHITIIEKDPEVIKIFKNHIFDFFPNKNKIEIVQDDFIKYMKTHRNLQEFDYIFADLWHTPEDGLPLFDKIIKISKLKNVKVDCWLNKSMISYVRRCLLSVFEEYYLNYSDKDYQSANNIFEVLINRIYYSFKNKEFDSIEKVKETMSDDFLFTFLGNE